MKNSVPLFLFLFIILSGCKEPAPFREVSVNNPSFVPDTAFYSYEDLSSPKFTALKEKYQLDTVLKNETDELKRILLLRHWIHQKIKIDNKGPYPGDESAESILDEALKGNGYHCGHFTQVQNAVMNAYGYIARCLLADVGVPVEPIDDEGHHAINEVWLNSYHKWFLSDAKYDYHFEKNGVPLSGLEIRDEYFKNKAADIVLVKGPDRVPTASYPELHNRTPEKFARIYTWLSWGRYNNRYTNCPKTETDYMVVFEDEYFKTHTWYWDGKPFWGYNEKIMRRLHDRRAIEWTPNSIESEVNIKGAKATIALKSVTPNLKTYQLKKIPGGEWKNVANVVELDLTDDTNELLFRTQNIAGVTGPEHKVVIER